ncbi:MULTISPECIES: IclR family transcriptional regulator domain-containing protein [Marinovum]|uniref:IclR family transcriptional regulator domain-containing protein n=1 Tax=Marinovum TaxID=367771 RepID=UPI00237B83A5|nr:IclR family transcriptional regulator C-terminal domain-containing protein [Marinovum sp. PR37]MDD9746434.1 IclR family transcriptional regulator C-terminal domain-containing protein [Marinovum sp. PR37]
MLNKTDTIASFAKGLSVIESFSAERPRMAIKDVAEVTGLDRSTARRCLLTLTSLGYAEFDGKYFTLTAKIMRLGMDALSTLPLPRTVQPWLEQLSEQLGQACSVTILDGTEVVFVARAAKRRIMSVGLMVGSRLPVHCAAMGRVMLAALPEAQALAILEASDLSPRTPKALTRTEDIMARIAEARANGYCFVDQETEIGLRSLAVPILNKHGQTVAAVNTGMIATEEDPQAIISRCLPSLLAMQSSLKRVLP